jgi:hypothetical protein
LHFLHVALVRDFSAFHTARSRATLWSGALAQFFATMMETPKVHVTNFIRRRGQFTLLKRVSATSAKILLNPIFEVVPSEARRYHTTLNTLLFDSTRRG